MNVVCKNIGCNERFKWSAQMYHHLNNCKYPEPPILSKYKKVGNQFECNSCKKCFSHQPNVTRHVIICKGIKQKKVYKCAECKKQFQYHSLLKKHLVSHSRVTYQCKSCQRVFKRSDHFTKHELNCTVENSNLLVPSFVSNVLNSTTIDLEVLTLSNSDSFVEDQLVPGNYEIDSQLENDESVSLNENNDFVPSSNSIVSVNTSCNWKLYREANEKTKNLESIIQSLTSPVKSTVKKSWQIQF